VTESTDVVLGLVLDPAKQAAALKGIKDVEKSVDSLSESVKKGNEDLLSGLSDFNKEVDALNKASKDGADNSKKAVDKVKDSIKQSAAELKQERQEANAVNREIAKLAGIARVSEQAIEKLPDHVYKLGQNALQAQLNFHKVRAEIQGLTRASSAMQQVGQGLTLFGVAAVGGLFAAGSKEANRQRDAREMTVTTEQWLKAQRQIELSWERVGRVAEATVLPALQQVAGYAEKASKYIEAHPELAKTLLMAGVVAAGLGTILTVAAKGIRIYADVKYLAANVMFNSATDKFVAGVAAYAASQGVGGAAGGVAKVAAGGALASAGTAGLILAVGAVLVEVERRIINFAMGTDKSFGDLLETAKQLSAVFGFTLLKAMQELGLNAKKTDPELWAMAKGIDRVGEAAASAQEELDTQGFNIIVDLEKKNIEAEQSFAVERAKIIANESASLLAAGAKLASSLDKINSDLSRAVSKITSNFNAANIQAEQAYQKQIADIQKQGRDQIIQIRRDEQEALRKLEEEHNQRMGDLTDSRDALGLVKEQDAYEKQKSEIQRSADEAAAEARKQTKERLKEARAAYQAETEQRRAQYEEDLKTAREQAAQARADAEKAHAEEVKAIQAETKQKLADQQATFNEEKRQRVLAANAQIRDLGTAKNAERALLNRYYGWIIADTKNYAEAVRRAMPSGGSAPVHDYTGYAYKGLYAMAQNGQRQFVLSGEATRAAESVVGGRLTPQNVGKSMGGNSQNIYVQVPNGMTVMELHRTLAQSEASIFNKIAEALGDAGGYAGG
jgi:chromosome segregation ATPase